MLQKATSKMELATVHVSLMACMIVVPAFAFRLSLSSFIGTSKTSQNLYFFPLLSAVGNCPEEILL